MTDQEVIQILINGGTVSITDDAQFNKVRKEIREIKKNCNIVLSQMKEQAKNH